MSETDSSGGVNPTGDTIPVTGDMPTAIPDSTSDAVGGPQIPGTPGLPSFPEVEGDDATVASAMLGTAVSLGVAAAAGVGAAAAAPVAAVAAAAALIMLTAEGDGDAPHESTDPADSA